MENIRKFINIVESSGSNIAPVEWPTNLAWRIQLERFKNVASLTDLRKNKLFAMPFRNWVGTYWNLLGKDIKKIRYMKTQVLQIPDSAYVADMELIDNFFYLNNGHSVENPSSDAMRQIEEYERTAIRYADFKSDPYVFSRPEILVEPGTATFLPMKVFTTAEMDPDDHMTPLLGVKTISK